MTVENEMYASGWVKCSRCGVSDALARRTYDAPSKSHRCTDVGQCDDWRAELKAKGLVVPPRPEWSPLPVRKPAPSPQRPPQPQTKAQVRAEVRARMERDSAGIKDWAAKPWVNKHLTNGKASK